MSRFVYNPLTKSTIAHGDSEPNPPPFTLGPHTSGPSKPQHHRELLKLQETKDFCVAHVDVLYIQHNIRSSSSHFNFHLLSGRWFDTSSTINRGNIEKRRSKRVAFPSKSAHCFVKEQDVRTFKTEVIPETQLDCCSFSWLQKTPLLHHLRCGMVW